MLIEFPTPVSITSLGRQGFLDRAWPLVRRRAYKDRLLQEIYEIAGESIAVPAPVDSESIAMFRSVLKRYRELCIARDELEARAGRVLEHHPDYVRMLSVPGIGPIVALTILAEAGDLRRFGHHRQFLKFCGFDLSTQQSGDYRSASRLSKRGNARLRTAFWIAASVAVKQRENSFRSKFNRYVQRDPTDPDLPRKGRTAVAAKIARVVYSLVKSDSSYRPFHEEAVPGGRTSIIGPSRRAATS